MKLLPELYVPAGAVVLGLGFCCGPLCVHLFCLGVRILQMVVCL